MYIFANRGLGMSSGKLSAQVAHGAVEAFRISNIEMLQAWYSGGHYTKLVMLARDEQHIENIETYLHARGIKTVLIIDEGVTEVDAHVKTALGVEIVDKSDPHILKTFECFELYRDKIRFITEVER